ncbi:MAG: 3-methyladenine DNA glycosylase [Salinisphaeraceae bacterium]|nr:3-methyladenine DNA glycosylase [Salinisphaeraceae bacterium]
MLATLHERNGYPPLWPRNQGFSGLVFIMLGQQVSTASQAAAYRRLQSVAGRVTPAALLRQGEEGLQAAGLTRQKQRYCLALADAVHTRRLRLAALAQAPDDAVREALQAIPGIGRWTADVYLFVGLRRPDVWPVGDLALDKAVRRLAPLPPGSDTEAVAKHAQRWAPWRAVAARMLWQDYLARPRHYRPHA